MLAYEETGSGRPLVFLHDLACRRSTWRPVVTHLQDEFRCVSVDLPGHGQSPVQGLDSLSATVSLNALCGALGLVEPVLVGHVSGAAIALMHASLYPGAPVVAVDLEPLHLPHYADRLEPYVDGLTGDGFAAAYRAWRAVHTLGPVDRTPALEQRVLLAWLKNLLRREDAVALQPGWEELLTSVRVPVLFLRSRAPSTEDAALLRRMASTELVVVPASDRPLDLDDPEGFARRLRDFLAQHA